MTMTKRKSQQTRPASRKTLRSRSRKTCNKLDINTCSLTSLRQLKLPTKSVDAIVKYRRKFKCFTHINELLRLKSVDAETFKIIHSLCKVDMSTEELRDMLHRRRRSEVTYKTELHRSHRARRSKSDPICNRLSRSRRTSSHSGLSCSASLMSLRSSRSGRKAALSRSMASMLSGLWRGKRASRTRIAQRSPARRGRSAADIAAAKSLSKVGSDILSSLSSTFLHTEKPLPARRSSSSTAQWVSDVQKRASKTRAQRSCRPCHKRRSSRNSTSRSRSVRKSTSRSRRSVSSGHRERERMRRRVIQDARKKESCAIM